MRIRGSPAALAIEVDFEIGTVFDAMPAFTTQPLGSEGRIVRPGNLGLYLKNPETSDIYSTFVKGMPVENYDWESGEEIPLVIRKICPPKADKKGVIYVEPRLEIGDAVLLKPMRKANKEDSFFTRYLSYDVIINPTLPDGRQVYAEGPVAAIISHVNKKHTFVRAEPYERVDPENYAKNQHKIIRASDTLDRED